MQYVLFIHAIMYYTALVEVLLLLSLVSIEWDTCQDKKDKSS